jgi:hypothetical protein
MTGKGSLHGAGKTIHLNGESPYPLNNDNDNALTKRPHRSMTESKFSLYLLTVSSDKYWRG